MNIDGNQGGILERNKNNKIYELLDDLIISVKKFGYGIDSWKQNLNELIDYIKINKKPLAKSLNNYEKKLGKWLENQVYDYKQIQNIMKLSEIRNIWDNFVNEYKDLFIQPNDIWKSRLNDLEEFIILNNRLPTQAKDEDEITFKLAKWIVRNNEEFKNNEKAMKDLNNRQLWTDFKLKYSNLFNEKLNEWNQKINIIN